MWNKADWLKYSLVVGLVLYICTSQHHADAFIGRRRRRSGGCSPVNCQWSQWSSWGSCNHPCGNAGEQKRTRIVEKPESCGGSCSGSSEETRACNRMCYNEGKPQHAYCDCVDEFWHTCCDRPCTAIDNCENLYCDSGSDHQCLECEYTRGGEKVAYRLQHAEGYDNRICEQVCSWRPDSLFCFPGNCTEEVPDSCTCADGYSATNCMRIDRKPDSMHCIVRGSVMEAGVEIDFMDFTVLKESLTVYTNMYLTDITFDWQSRFEGPSASEYPLPYYIDSGDFSIGLTRVEIPWQMKEGENQVSSTLDCSQGFSKDNPNQGTHSCEDGFTLPVAEHADVLKMSLEVENGGFVKISNYDDLSGPVLDPPQYYNGQIERHEVDIVFDFVAPEHCSLTSSCDDDMIARPAYTKNEDITVTWHGWEDLSDIKLYELEVYEMVAFGEDLGLTSSPIIQEEFNHTTLSHSFSFATPGSYCILLTVDDHAGNHRRSRRFLVYDNTTSVSISEHPEDILFVSSAAANTSYLWVTSTSDETSPGPRVEIVWPGVFRQEFHHTQKLLNTIRDHIPPIDEGYEETTGQPPVTRSRARIPNAYGTYKSRAAYGIDHEGGDSITEPSPDDWVDVLDVEAQETSLDITRNDGDSIRIFIKGYDVVENSVTETVLVHVDSSPPEIVNVCLKKDGPECVVVHDSLDLFEAKLKFDAFDHHSGLKEIHWELHDRANPDIVHGTGHLAVRRPTAECTAPLCYCIPKDTECYYRDYVIEPDASKMNISEGEHEYDYYYVVTITNGAMLKTVYTFQMTIDLTPPHTGVVRDSPPGTTDRDYQSATTLHGSWEGFFDPESGIMVYQYAFSDTCMTAEDFGFPAPNSMVHNTSSTFASLEDQSEGHYHVTVVAYNHALDPSKPVCSSGVVIDMSPPLVTGIHVQNVMSNDGLMGDEEGNLWYLTRDSFKCQLINASDVCWNVTEETFEVSLFKDGDRARCKGIEDCEGIGVAGLSFGMHTERQLELDWMAIDPESGIYDNEVGIASEHSDIPDLMPFTSTHGHHHLLTYHPNLDDSQTFSILVKSINKAGTETIEKYGPITVQITPPWFEGVIILDTLRYKSEEYLLATWNASSFDENEFEDGLIYKLWFSVGHQPEGEEIQKFKPVTEENTLEDVCWWSSIPECIVIPTATLDWHLHGSHDYYVTLKVEGLSGLSRIVTSDVYIHYSGPPSHGMVYEVSLDHIESHRDIDYQSNNTAVLTKWNSFHHADQEVIYEVGLGSKPYLTDVVPFQIVDGEGQLLMVPKGLEYFESFYVTINASTDDGYVLSSSNGLTILPTGAPISGLQIMDGFPCPPERLDDTLVVDNNTLCGTDHQFQASVTQYRAYWDLPDELVSSKHIQYIQWTIEEYTNGEWFSLETFSEPGYTRFVTATDQHLEAGYRYRAVVEFCHPDGCYEAIASSGITITPDPPVPGSITGFEFDGSNITFSWELFTDPHAPSDVEAISHYDWTLFEETKTPNERPQHQFFSWILLTEDDIVQSTSKTIYTATVAINFTITNPCVVLAVRGHNHVKMHSISYMASQQCSQEDAQPVVYDAVGAWEEGEVDVQDIYLEENGFWDEPDKEFTRSARKLSAVWPSLRHGKYSWKVVQDDRGSGLGESLWERIGNINYDSIPCHSPLALACGEMEDNFVNVGNLPLLEGHRYYVCIWANATVLHFENFDQLLPEVSACSNGIVVDLSAPEPGIVTLGHQAMHLPYQVDKHILNIYWDGFTDAEYHGTSIHYSGIVDYKYTIGSTPGGVDVREITSVGNLQMITVNELVLHDGATYYVTITALDSSDRETAVNSDGITIDSTPPTVNIRPVKVEVIVLDGTPVIEASWEGVFEDVESGVQHFTWCVGSQPRHCDIRSFESCASEHASSSVDDDLKLLDGYVYFVYVQAKNNVALTAETTSSPVLVDSTPPVPGNVYDGNTSTDYDFQVSVSELHAHWFGFSDPHSQVTEYNVCVGTCPGCMDVLEWVNMGLLTEFHLDYLTLVPGQRYHTTVKACNGANLCTEVSSDGLIPDNTPPIPGSVLDGIGGIDEDFQAPRTTVGAHWYNFHDVHSGISHYEWRAGTSPGGNEIFTPARLHISNKAKLTLHDKTLPLAQKVYVTIRAYNRAGLWVEQTSNGFIVDITAPIIEAEVDIDQSVGSIVNNTQVWTSSLTVTWQTHDDESGIAEQHLAVLTDDPEHLNIPAAKLLGNVQQFTFTNLTMSDGQAYTVKLAVCNRARLCTTSLSPAILVDNSPPKPGAFAVETDHAVDLGRYRDGWMTYESDNTSVVYLAWVGFSDPHTTVSHYYVTIGTTYRGSELIEETPVEIEHTEDDEHGDEGHIQTAAIDVTQYISAHQQLYISIWAENMVGLQSEVLTGMFEAIPSQSTLGTLALLRRCQSVSCEGHCTCAPQGQKCDTSDCKDVTGLDDFAVVKVCDIVDYQPWASDFCIDVHFTPTQCAMGGQWELAEAQYQPRHLEWSVGVQGSPVGSGLLDTIHESVWKDIGHPETNLSVFTTGSSQLEGSQLEPNVPYVFYIRAWYNDTCYGVYSSSGLLTDYTPPELSSSYSVKETRNGSTTEDIDFTTSTSELWILWEYVFRDAQVNISRFIVLVGTYPGLDDITALEFSGGQVRAEITGVNLVHGQKYFATVEACNEAGLCRTATSDGVTVDTTDPLLGAAWDGIGPHDMTYSAENSSVAAFWHGFTDPESYLHHYEWCTGTSPGECNLTPFNNVGLAINGNRQLPGSLVLSDGTRVYSTVVVINGAGLKSTPITSDGYTIDSTPPQEVHKYMFSNNLVENPSFEEVEVDEESGYNIPVGWHCEGDSVVLDGEGSDEGNRFLEVNSGYIQQVVPTKRNTRYRLIFQVAAPRNGDSFQGSVAFVTIGDLHISFGPSYYLQDSGTNWQKHVYFFTGNEHNSTLVFGLLDKRASIWFDSTEVVSVKYGTPGEGEIPSGVESVQVHLGTVGHLLTVSASWEIEDLESPVTSFWWAVGTVKGGTQLQSFLSTGRRPYAKQTFDIAAQGLSVYVTVMAENAAGLRMVVRSDGYPVDLTPPLVCCLMTSESNKEPLYTTTTLLSVAWTAQDPESGIESCEWAVGHSPGSQELLTLTPTDTLQSSQVDLLDAINDGMTLHVTIKCKNVVDLTTTLLSDPIHVVMAPPDATSAKINVVTTSMTHHETRDSYQSTTDRLSFGWHGFYDAIGIGLYEISLTDTNGDILLPWQTIGSGTEHFSSFSGLKMLNMETYQLWLRAVGLSGLISQPVATNFTVETDAPVASDQELMYQWMDANTVKLDWTGIFSGGSPLVYTVHMGTHLGGADVLRWKETKWTNMAVEELDHTKEHYVTIEAVNRAGLFSTRSYLVTYNS